MGSVANKGQGFVIGEQYGSLENSLALPLGFKGERYENCDLYLDGYMFVASASRILTTCYSK